MVNDTTRLLGLDGLAVDRVELRCLTGPPWSIWSPLMSRHDSVRTAVCGHSGSRSGRRPGRGICRWPAVRPGCGGANAAGTATRPPVRAGRSPSRCAQVPARARLTRRLRQAAGAAVADAGRTIVQAARDHDLSWPVVAAAFTAHAPRCCRPSPTRSTVLGIDEIRRGRPRWIFDEVTGSWTDDRRPVARRVLRSVRRTRAARPGRGPHHRAVIDWLRATPAARGVSRSSYVAIDMCTDVQGRRPRGPARTPSWSWTTSTSCNWPTGPSPRSAAASPSTHRGRRGRNRQPRMGAAQPADPLSSPHARPARRPLWSTT